MLECTCKHTCQTRKEAQCGREIAAVVLGGDVSLPLGNNFHYMECKSAIYTKNNNNYFLI